MDQSMYANRSRGRPLQRRSRVSLTFPKMLMTPYYAPKTRNQATDIASMNHFGKPSAPIRNPNTIVMNMPKLANVIRVNRTNGSSTANVAKVSDRPARRGR